RFDLCLRLFFVDLDNWHFDLLFISFRVLRGATSEAGHGHADLGGGWGRSPQYRFAYAVCFRVQSWWKIPFPLVPYADPCCAGSWADGWAVSVDAEEVGRPTIGKVRKVSNCCPGSRITDCGFNSGRLPVFFHIWY